MARIVHWEVADCHECPWRYYDYSTGTNQCTDMDHRVIKPNDSLDFPEWCPLPIADTALESK